MKVSLIRDLTEAEMRALKVCRQLASSSSDKTFTPTELGEELWRETAKHRMRQSMARPAGKVIKALIASGHLCETTRSLSNGRTRTAYTTTHKGD